MHILFINRAKCTSLNSDVRIHDPPLKPGLRGGVVNMKIISVLMIQNTSEKVQRHLNNPRNLRQNSGYDGAVSFFRKVIF